MENESMNKEHRKMMKDVMSESFDVAWKEVGKNCVELWEKIKENVTSAMDEKFDNGYFPGKTHDDAFFVTCDENNNGDGSDEIVCDLGIAPYVPGEFLISSLIRKLEDEND